MSVLDHELDGACLIRLGIYTPTYPGVSGDGGIGKYVREAARGLTNAGHNVHVLTLGDGPTVYDGSVTVHRCQHGPLPLFDRLVPGAGACVRVGRRLRALVQEYGLNVVEFPNWEGLAPFFAWQRSVPLVVRLHTSSLESIAIEGSYMTRPLRWDVRRERLTARMADCLVTHSEAHREAMARELGIACEKIAVIPHGIAAVSGGDNKEVRDEETVVYLGRMERRKGTLDLINAVPIVLRQVPTAKFVLIGTDRPHCPGGLTHVQYADRVLAPQARQAIQFAGRLSDTEVDTWLRRAAVFVAPSIYESFGLIFLEAMRWGTPVVGTRVGGIPEIVEHERTGVLVPPESPRALAAGIVRLLGSPNDRCAMGEAGRQRSEREFSTDKMVQRLVELYEKAIAGFRR